MPYQRVNLNRIARDSMPRPRSFPGPDDGRADDTTPPAGDAGADPQAELDQLAAELKAAQAQAAEHFASLQRTAAEFSNFRRRTSEEREREAGLASEYLIRKVLILADDFDRALDAMPKELAGTAWIEGVTAIDRKLRGLLESEGVRPIEVLGAQFDPREHEAITSVGGTGRPDGEVVAEIQRGYRIRDRVLRPALVAVAAGSAAGSETGSSTDSAAGSGAGSEAAQTSGPNGRSADGSPTNGSPATDDAPHGGEHRHH